MWHEVRKQERKIRGMLVDYRKRAVRRQDFYEKIRADPTQFMQIYGREYRIHLDPAVAAANNGSTIIVPWQGQQDNLIDRFDVRAHLDYIPPMPKNTDVPDVLTSEERQCNYERYRILAQNDFLGITEDKFFHQLHLEEQFGAISQMEAHRSSNKKKPNAGVAIGYTYDNSTTPFGYTLSIPPVQKPQPSAEGEVDSESDEDMDVSVDISKLDTSQAHELNACGRNYGMESNDFYSFLTKDADEADALRMAREEEQEKIMLNGRKSRRERKAKKERRIVGRPFSPPSYAAKEETISNANDDSESRSPSPEISGKITYITSFGGEDELQTHSHSISKPQKAFGTGSGIGPQVSRQTMTYAEKVKENLEKLKQMNQMNKKRSDSPTKPRQYQRSRTSSRRSSRSCSRYRRRRSRSNYRSRRDRRRSSSGLYSRRRRRRSRSRSYDRQRRHSKSRSRSRSRLRLRSRSRSRSKSYKARYRHRRRSYSESSSSSSSYYESKRRNGSIKTKNSKTNLPNKKSSKSLSKSVNSGSLPKPTISTVLPTVIQQEPLAKFSATIRNGLNSLVNQSNEQSSDLTPATTCSIPPSIPLPVEDFPHVPIKRYYGRRKEDMSSSSDEEFNLDGSNQPDTSNSEISNTFPTAKATTVSSNPNITQFGKLTAIITTPSSLSSSETKAFTSGQTASFSALSNFHDALNASSKMGNATLNLVGALGGNGAGGATGASGAGVGVGGAVTQVNATQKKMNLTDRLKRKMQLQLNKQYKADKKAEIERTERQIQQQQEREEEMREMGLKLRRRQRELRHKYGTPTSSPEKSSSGSEENEGSNTVEPRSGVINKSTSQLKSQGESESQDKDREKRSRSRSRARSDSKSTRRRSRTRSTSRKLSVSRRVEERDKDRDRERENSKNKDRDRDRNRNWNRNRDRDRDRDRHRDRNPYRDRERDRRDRDRNRDRSRSSK